MITATSPPLRDPRSLRDLLLWLGGGLVGIAALWWWTQPSDGAGAIWCQVRRAGLPCPGCGLTRGLGALLRGDLVAAWFLHPLALPVALEVVGLWLLSGWWRLRRGYVPFPDGPQLVHWATLHAVAFLALWLGRSATGTLPL